MVVAAAIIGGSALAAGGIGASSSKKGNEGQAMLGRIAQEIFTETTPERRTALTQSIQAMLTGKADTPELQAQRSAISSGGERQKTSLKSDLTRQGLQNSSVGVAAQEDI